MKTIPLDYTLDCEYCNIFYIFESNQISEKIKAQSENLNVINKNFICSSRKFN